LGIGGSFSKIQDNALRRELHKARTRTEVFNKIKHLKRAKRPLVNLPETTDGSWGQGLTADKMKKCVWLLCRMRIMQSIFRSASRRRKLAGDNGFRGRGGGLKWIGPNRLDAVDAMGIDSRVWVWGQVLSR
jgi:hypothetical protein